MKKLFKSLLPILLVVSLIFTMGVGTISQNGDMTEKNTQEEIKDPPEEVKEAPEEEAKEEAKEEPQEEPPEEVKKEVKEEAKQEEKPKKEEVKKPQEKTQVETIKEVEAESEEDPQDQEMLEEENIAEKPENYPDMLGEPGLVFPNVNFRTMGTRTAISDTIEVNKTAARSEGCRTFEVTLDITGTPQEAPVDVVLVIDRSGSMKDGTVDEYVAITTDPSTNKSYYVKIGGSYQVVSYSSGGFLSPQGWYYGSLFNRRYVSWDANGDDNSPGGNSNNPVGKPFYERQGLSRLYYAKQAAVNFAAKVLGPNGIPGSRVSIVSYSGTGGTGVQGNARTDQDLTSDISLVNTAINGLVADGGTNTQAGFRQSKNVIQGSISNQNPNSNKVVIMFTDGMPTSSNGNAYGPNDPTSHNNHTIAAYTAGQDIYNNGIADVFTVGLFEGMTGSVYNLAVNTLTRAQNKGFYDAPTAAALDGIFDDISTQLGYAATNAKVVDEIGGNFDLVETSLPAGAIYNAGDREISWNPGTIVSSAQLKYVVQAKPSFAGGLADTNGVARLTYKDIFGTAGITKDFPVPEVNVPTLLKVKLTDASIIAGNSISLGLGTDPLGENYMDISGGDGTGTYSYEWRKVGDSNVISTDENPSVNPTEDTQYEVTVTDSNGCIAVATMWVKVTKKFDIGIKKVAKGSSTLLDGAKFELKEVGEATGTEVVVTNGFEWMNDLLPGNYTLQETQAPVGYQLNPQIYTITIAANGDISVDPSLAIESKDGKQVLVVENDLLEFDIRLKKVDKESGTLLDGAEFELKKGGQVIPTPATANGYIDLNNLLAGTYTLKETQAPVGYELNNTEYTITIAANGNITIDPELEIVTEDGKQVIVMENDLLEFDIGLKKIDKKTGALLDGAKFVLKNEDGDETEINVVDGYIDINNLLAGDYTFQETKAPEGYRLNNTEYTVTISPSGQVTADPELTIETVEGKQVVVVKNSEKTVFPSTGGPGSMLFILLGIGLMAGSYIGSKKTREGQR